MCRLAETDLLVAHCSHGGTDFSLRIVTRQTKVDDLDFEGVLHQHDVLWFDVAVDDPDQLKESQCRGQLKRKLGFRLSSVIE